MGEELRVAMLRYDEVVRDLAKLLSKNPALVPNLVDDLERLDERWSELKDKYESLYSGNRRDYWQYDMEKKPYEDLLEFGADASRFIAKIRLRKSAAKPRAVAYIAGVNDEAYNNVMKAYSENILREWDAYYG